MLGKYNQLERGIGSNLPAAYKKFYKEWKFTQPTVVHSIPTDSNWKRDETTNGVFAVQDIPIPLKYPSEYDKQMWGGEGIIQGFTKKKHYNRRNPTFWLPTLHRSVIYSEILDKHISVVLTERALQLIHSNYGFDHYILKTPACDLKSLLALGLKRKMLEDLKCGCQSYLRNPQKQEEIFEKYKMYLSSYTSEEIEWYGYSFQEACEKWLKIAENQRLTFPLKVSFREDLNLKLKTELSENREELSSSDNEKSWFTKLNPFVKKEA